MKKTVSKLKKILLSILLVITAIPKKVFARTTAIAPDKINSNSIVNTNSISLYGVREPTPITLGEIVIIPLAILIGVVVYYKKSKSNKKKLITIGIIAATVIWCIAIIIYKFYLKLLYA